MNHDDKLSFLPEDYVQRRIERRTNLICLTLFAVVLTGIIGAWTVTKRHKDEVAKQLQAMRVSYTDAAKRLEQLDELQKRKQQMLRKAHVTRMLIEPVPRTFLLADLINRMPKSLSLFEFELHSKMQRPTVHVNKAKSALANQAKAPPTEQELLEAEVPRYQVSLILIGVAPTDVQVAQYMSSLSRSPLMTDVNLIFSEETQIADSTMRKFRIEAMLSEKADVRNIDPEQLQRDLKKDPMTNNPTAQPIISPTPGPEAEPASQTIVDGSTTVEE
ncbi:PilN domain-containing protein [Planctomycetales bacterium ZRK34]|nr:PilN domain-containing protein [Planctomycetales bacterium ZRK34]